MKDRWEVNSPISSVNVCSSFCCEEAEQSRVVAMIELMHTKQVAALKSLVAEFGKYLSKCDLLELGEIVAWQEKHSKIYYQRAQASIYCSIDDDTAASIAPILSSYNKIMDRLQNELLEHKAEERGAAVMHFANWLVGAPRRFALRLLQFEINILQTTLEEKSYVENNL